MIKVEYYVLTKQESERHYKMKMRFENENINAHFSPVVEFNDERLNRIPDKHKRATSCMLGHLDMFRKFMESDADFGIFCEDDIHIRRGIKEIIPETIAKYKRQKLEILMLGYLFPFKPVELSFYHEPEFYNQKLDIIDENLIYFTDSYSNSSCYVKLVTVYCSSTGMRLGKFEFNTSEFEDVYDIEIDYA